MLSRSGRRHSKRSSKKGKKVTAPGYVSAVEKHDTAAATGTA